MQPGLLWCLTCEGHHNHALLVTAARWHGNKALCSFSQVSVPTAAWWTRSCTFPTVEVLHICTDCLGNTTPCTHASLQWTGLHCLLCTLQHGTINIPNTLLNSICTISPSVWEQEPCWEQCTYNAPHRQLMSEWSCSTQLLHCQGPSQTVSWQIRPAIRFKQWHKLQFLKVCTQSCSSVFGRECVTVQILGDD
jgi:hypothetical protein